MERKAVYMCTEYSVVYIGITNEKRKFFLNDKNFAHTFIMFLFLWILYDCKEYETGLM